ncbi:hypothetical protein Tco_1448816 [Tanacetum coccineum]
MSDLKFADTHNLVAFLEKPTESEGYGILSKQKTVNGEVQLQALVDKKKVIITESTIRRDLQLEDANGVDCLQNVAIFKQLTLMGGKGKGFSGRVTPLFQTMMVQAQEEMGKDENVPTTFNDPLLSGEDRLKLTELMDLYTNLQKKVLDLEKAKTTQDSEIASLKKKDKKIERRNKSKTPGFKRLRKERKIADIDADAEEVEVEKVVSTAEVTTESATTTTVDELTLARTLIDIKDVKPKVRGVMI